ncbi:hypothetical protein Lepto7376_2312 [[Leptolyngbya] sp. PCC 7376]|nr:hypothetical protein Lepto7376_2312 [[Leptolyngbya] sp. PCC 7376]
MKPMRIAYTGNTEVPAYLSLVSLGFEISVKDTENQTQIWKATNGKLEVVGEAPLELLALIKLIECRGEDWKASDREINEFINKYC